MGLTIATEPLDVTSSQEEADELEEVVVKGLRIRRNPLNEPTAITEIGKPELPGGSVSRVSTG